MAICLVTGKCVQFGNNVSKSNRKVKKIFKSNIRTITLFSKVLGKCRLNLSARGLSTIEKKGGLDSYLNSTKIVFGEKGKNIFQKYQKILNKKEIQK